MKFFLHPIPIIYNFRTKFVGLNQRKSIFNLNFELDGDYVLDIFY